MAFNTANFAFRQVNYHATGDWGQACRTSREHFSPIETFEARFDDLMGEVDALGFKNVELWHFHLHQKWWTPEHVQAARSVAARRGMQFVAYCGGFGDDLAEVERTLELVTALGIPLLAGASRMFTEQRREYVARLRAYGVRFGYENHPEKTPQELLERAGPDEDGLVGVTVDTGWFGVQAYPADQAVRELGGRVLHVHLKDVLEVGTHQTVGYGQGVVPLRAVVDTLAATQYRGYISMEHEPEQFDPADDLRASRLQLHSWLHALTGGPTPAPVVP
ncbi:sugar phosphate isomerase/epimerase family protein [Deinococcus oregonensis]|uniref:Sugar phosphate isomerase/epimerase family protein n=1 Tax=Deinococcus oregonensis TaxID=1805970 RepID=A0ABV6AUE9_9DEIO